MLASYIARLSLTLCVALFPSVSWSAAVELQPHGPRYFEVPQRGDAQHLTYDVAVYGGTPAGVTAAIQAARLGKNTILLSFNQHVGGLTSGGLTATDVGNRKSIGGLANEFYMRLGALKDFSPAHAERVYRDMLKEAGVTVLYGRPLEAVTQADARISALTFMTGETVAASMFIDATYEGDLFAAAGVSYRVGREPRSAFDESLAGQWQQESWKGVYQFCLLPISPYVEPNNPASGLLPEIATEPAGKPGQGDNKIQAYNFRMFLSNKADRIPFPKPTSYDANRYALLARFLNFDDKLTWTLNYTTKKMTDGPVQMRNGDSNNAGSFSSDYVGGNFLWADGTYTPGSFDALPPSRRGLPIDLPSLYEMREKIFQDHVAYQLGLMYFLATDKQVPPTLQARVNAFGLDAKEFAETGHWPHQLYVREARRMVSSYIVTDADCRGKRVAEDSVGLASYGMDSHFCQRVVVQEGDTVTVRNEGGFVGGISRPYPISYRAIVPMRDECVNLLVPLCLSSSHVAYGSIRMEPVFMILGQSAANAACLAIDSNIAVQDVPYPALKDKLLAQQQVLTWDKK